jgi:hypothetical protein
MSTELVRYDAMCTAIAEAHAIDEVKDIRDKALALAAYARQAKNFEMEIWLCEIRLQAERKAGEIRSAMEKATGAEYGGRAKIDGARAEVSNRPPKEPVDHDRQVSGPTLKSQCLRHE